MSIANDGFHSLCCRFAFSLRKSLIIHISLADCASASSLFILLRSLSSFTRMKRDRITIFKMANRGEWIYGRCGNFWPMMLRMKCPRTQTKRLSPPMCSISFPAFLTTPGSPSLRAVLMIHPRSRGMNEPLCILVLLKSSMLCLVMGLMEGFLLGPAPVSKSRSSGGQSPKTFAEAIGHFRRMNPLVNRTANSTEIKFIFADRKRRFCRQQRSSLSAHGL